MLTSTEIQAHRIFNPTGRFRVLSYKSVIIYPNSKLPSGYMRKKRISPALQSKVMEKLGSLRSA